MRGHRKLVIPTLRLVILASVGIVAPLAGHAQELAPGCSADLAAVDESFSETLDRLDSVVNLGDAEKCSAYRHHVEVMLKGREGVPALLAGRTRSA